MMRWALVALAIALAAPTAAQTLEPDARISSPMDQEGALILAAYIRALGWKCDTVSAAWKDAFRNDRFNVSCNHRRYRYKVADKGGQWIVTVKD